MGAVASTPEFRYESAVVGGNLVASRPSIGAARILSEASTLTAALVELTDTDPDWPCLTFFDRTRTTRTLALGTLRRIAETLRAELLSRGLCKGDIVVLILPTGAELVGSYLGALLAGGVPALAPTQTQRVASPEAYLRVIAGFTADGPARFVISGGATAELLRHDGKKALAGAILVQIDDLSTAAPANAPTPLPDPDAIATIQYSSGSTGLPKGVRLSHQAMLNNMRSIREALEIRPDDVSVNWIPLYHDMGLIDAFLLPLLSGCPSILIPTSDFIVEPELWLEAIHRYRGTLSWAPNFAYALCVQRVTDESAARLDLSSWRVAVNAAEPLLAKTIHDFSTRFRNCGFRREAMTPAWGLAENVTIATACRPDEEPRVERIDKEVLTSKGWARVTTGDGVDSVSIGRCLPSCEVEIREGERVLGDDEVGEIWLRSDSLFTSYHGDPRSTDRVLQRGWLCTGDQGYTSNGELFFVSRMTDVIVIAGQKYAPHVIESAVDGEPGVRRGCVVALGLTDSRRGTEGLAIVAETKLDDPRDRQQLERRLRASISRATGLALTTLKLVEPGGVLKTTSGKLARRATRRLHFHEDTPGPMPSPKAHEQ